MIDIAKSISEYRDMLKDNMRPLSGKSGEPEDSDEEQPSMDDVFVKQLSQMQRKVTWGVGLVAYSYSYIKPNTLTLEQQKEEKPEQKMERLILDSKLLSGGIEKRFLSSFSDEAREQIKSVLEVSGDYTLHEMMEVPSQDQEGK